MANHKPDVTIWPTPGQIRASTETLARALGMQPYHFATLVAGAMQEKGLAAGKDDVFSAMFGSDGTVDSITPPTTKAAAG